MKQLTATIIATPNETTAIALVETSWKHPLYKKTVKRSKKYLVHNEVKAQLGQVVTLTETRPLSARKRFKITEVLK